MPWARSYAQDLTSHNQRLPSPECCDAVHWEATLRRGRFCQPDATEHVPPNNPHCARTSAGTIHYIFRLSAYTSTSLLSWTTGVASALRSSRIQLLLLSFAKPPPGLMQT